MTVVRLTLQYDQCNAYRDRYFLDNLFGVTSVDFLDIKPGTSFICNAVNLHNAEML